MKLDMNNQTANDGVVGDYFKITTISRLDQSKAPHINGWFSYFWFSNGSCYTMVLWTLEQT
jgi:hypothetical protein